MFALMVGVLVMTTILAGAPMYLSTIESLGLRAMLTQLSSSRNMQIVVDGLPLTDRSVSAATERVEVALEELDDLVVNIGQESHTREHYWATDAQSITSGPYADVALLGRFDGVLDEVEITDGRAPLSSLKRLDTHVVAEGLVPTKRADQLGIGVGDEIWLTTKPGDLPYLMVRVVGLFEPEDVRADFWLGLAPEVLEPGRPGPEARFRLPLFLTREALFGALTGGPAAIGTNRWLVQLDADLLERQSPTFTAEQVDSVGHELRRGLPESRAISALENPLISLGQKISFARIPTLMMGGVLLLAAGYYSIMAAGALMARRRVDTARMWVRGSGKRLVAVETGAMSAEDKALAHELLRQVTWLTSMRPRCEGGERGAGGRARGLPEKSCRGAPSPGEDGAACAWPGGMPACQGRAGRGRKGRDRGRWCLTSRGR